MKRDTTNLPEDLQRVRALAYGMEAYWETPGLTDAIESGNPARVARICFSNGIKHADEDILDAVGNYLEEFFEEDGATHGIIAREMRLQKQSHLVEQARQGDLVAWDTCAVLLIVKIYYREKKLLHNDIYKLAADSMRGTCRRRGKRGAKKKTVRDEHIYYSVLFTAAAGRDPYRNDASTPDSACDLVAEELRAHRAPLSYSAVAKIWSNQSKNQAP